VTTSSIAATGVQRSFDELGVPLHDVTFCTIDLETTGGNRHDDRITEIGAVKVRGGVCLGTFQTLVNPGRAIPPQISILTGLTDAVVADAPPVGAVLPSLIDFVGDAVIVGHNVGFDLGFLRAAFERHDRPPLTATVIDTVALARRLVRDEVPNCRLGTLASRFRLDHQPSHRALEDALATTDLLHLLIERAAGLGVTGLDDLVALAKLAGHPEASKLRMTGDLPRSPGVYMFRGPRGDVLYVGKATNLRRRVRSYFGSDDRRKVGPMLRETHSVNHVELPDPLTAEVIEQRMIASMLPRYNRAGTRVDKYCYVRLDVEAAWPRLSIVKQPSERSVHLGPLPSRAMATLVIEAIQAAVPLRRCTARLGRNVAADPDRERCTAAQLGVAHCPCTGMTDAGEYAVAVESARLAVTGRPEAVLERGRDKMLALAAQQRFEEAASVRDRLVALVGATRRHHLIEALRAAGRAEVRLGDITWTIDGARLLGAVAAGTVAQALPIAATEPTTAPVLPRHHVDEALCLARFFEKHAHRLTVEATGAWSFPIGDRLPELTPAPRPARAA
jgi:DNA polymerase-3 subunit epsilon